MTTASFVTTAVALLTRLCSTLLAVTKVLGPFFASPTTSTESSEQYTCCYPLGRYSLSPPIRKPGPSPRQARSSRRTENLTESDLVLLYPNVAANCEEPALTELDWKYLKNIGKALDRQQS